MTLNEILVDKGLVPNLHHLTINEMIAVPKAFLREGLWATPSMLFKYPIYHSNEQLYLSHPLLKDHPFVHDVERKLAVSIEWKERGPGCNFTWRHAIDLMSEGLWDQALETRQYTTVEDLAGAIAFCVRYPAENPDNILTLQKAKQLMRSLGLKEPVDRSLPVIRRYCKPLPTKSESTVPRWPVNSHYSISRLDNAWATIHGLEYGWFSNKDTGLTWTKAGIEIFENEEFGLLI